MLLIPASRAREAYEFGVSSPLLSAQLSAAAASAASSLTASSSAARRWERAVAASLGEAMGTAPTILPFFPPAGPRAGVAARWFFAGVARPTCCGGRKSTLEPGIKPGGNSQEEGTDGVDRKHEVACGAEVTAMLRATARGRRGVRLGDAAASKQ